MGKSLPLQHNNFLPGKVKNIGKNVKGEKH